MKIMIIGASGQLGSELVRAFPQEAIPLDIEDIDITDKKKIQTQFEIHEPDAVINTAAYHNVPQCENHLDMAFNTNTIGVKYLADLCQSRSIPLVHISTDYVFDGQKNSPYSEDDIPSPLNAYGISKLAGEYFAKQVNRHYIVRVSSLFGICGCRAKGGNNFVKTMLKVGKTRDRAEVTSNITSSPTYARDAAYQIKKLLDEDHAPGIYHVINGGSCSWYEFAIEIFKLAEISITVDKKIETEELEGVRRPLYSALITQKITPLRDWRLALKDYLKEENALQKEKLS